MIHERNAVAVYLCCYKYREMGGEGGERGRGRGREGGRERERKMERERERGRERGRGVVVKTLLAALCSIVYNTDSARFQIMRTHDLRSRSGRRRTRTPRLT